MSDLAWLCLCRITNELTETKNLYSSFKRELCWLWNSVYNEFVDRMDKSVPRVTVWHQAPLRQICLSFPKTYVVVFFLHTFGCQALDHFRFSVFSTIPCIYTCHLAEF